MIAVFRTMWLRIALIAAVLIAVGVTAFLVATRGSSGPELIAVRRDTVVQEVIVTGKTKPVKDVDLAFERAGRVASVQAAVGERVAAGAVLATLDQAELSSALAEAEANLASEQAKLANAELAVGDAERSMRDRLHDAYTKSDDAVRNRVDQFFSNPRGANPQLNFATDPVLESAIETERQAIESLLTGWQGSLAGLPAIGDFAEARAAASANLNRVSSFLGEAALALAPLRPTTSLTQATIDAWRADVSAGRVNVSTAAVNLSSAEEKLRGAPGAVDAARAARASAEAKIASARVALSKTLLRAPIAGIVTRQDAAVGEIVAANAALVSLISSQGFEIEANVPEVDIGRIQIGNPVRITFDAYPDDAVNGRVAKIDPAETIVDGVVNFRVTIAFNQTSTRVKSGLTANLAIQTNQKSDVLVLPQFAIIENDRGTFVRVPEGSATREVPVEIGIRGQDGTVEIVSGLREGDRVLSVGRKGSSQ